MKEYPKEFRVRVHWDSSISLPYWFFKKSGLLHNCKHLVWDLQPDGSCIMEPVKIVWIKAPKRKYKVVIHEGRDGRLWADVPALPGLKVEGVTTSALKQNVRREISAAILQTPPRERKD